MKRTILGRAVLVAVGASFAAITMPAQQYLQEGAKLTGTASSDSQFGSSVAVSADGTTIAICGPMDGYWSKSLLVGAVWVFTQQGGVWTQQAKIVPAEGARIVALSADGNTLFIGSPDQSSSVEIYNRSGGGWQFGSKLSGAGAVFHTYAPRFGQSLAVSRDGNTLAVGGPGDNDNAGAVWIFVRNNGTWTQQGTKLVAAASSAGPASFGSSVAVTADGNTLAAGASWESSYRGAVHLFQRSNLIWTASSILQGPTQVPGTGNNQGGSVAISDDGNTVLAGGGQAAWLHVRSSGIWRSSKLEPPLQGPNGSEIQVALARNGSAAFLGTEWHSNKTGSVWVYKPSNGAWQQDGTALLGTGATGLAGQGNSVALSADGSTLLVGGRSDATHDVAYSTGAAWVFVRPDVSLISRLTPSPSVYGAAVQLTAAITPAVNNLAAEPPFPAGTVQFTDGQTQLGTASVIGGTASISTTALAGGAHSISAIYSGDANWYPTSATVSHTVNPTPTTIGLALSGGGGSSGLVAAVSGATGGFTGSVEFTDATSNSILGTVPLSNSSATARLGLDAAQFRAIAGHSITASYSGDANFRGSTSIVLSLPAILSATGSTMPVFAAEQLVSIYGSTLSGETAQAATVPWPTALGKTTVSVVDSASVPRAAGLLYVSPGQINVQIPAGTAAGAAVIAIASATSSMAIPVQIAGVAPGVFTVSGNGTGAPAAQLLRVRPDGSSATTAVAGGISFGEDDLYLVLYGTGLKNRSSLSGVNCSFNGESIPVEYAGPQGQYPGLDQINVHLPPRLRGAGLVKVQLTVDGSAANVVELVFE